MLLLTPGFPVADFTEAEAWGGLRATGCPQGVQGRDGGAGQVRDPEQGQVGEVSGARGQGEPQRGQHQSEIWAHNNLE